MKQKLKDIFKGPVVFYPLLFAAFPVLFLYAYNINETSISQVWLPLVVSVSAALVLWAVLSLILGSLAKAGLATAIFLVFFFAYGRLYEVLENSRLFTPKHGYLLPVTLFVWGYCVYFISRAKRDFRTTTTVLNITAVVLIAINLFNIASYQIRLARLDTGTPEESTEQADATSPADLSALPDIYFIIFDEYAHPDTMKEWYDYDNSEFFNSLEDKGFFIASQSKTRTPFTAQVINQVLNMEYLTPGWEWDPEMGKYIERETNMIYRTDYIYNDVTLRKIAYSNVADFLKAHYYQYIVFGNDSSLHTRVTYIEEHADLYFNYHEEAATPWVSEFQEILWNTTMLRPFYHHLVGVQYENASRRGTRYTLEHLKALPEVESPKFVFAHFMCPHRPFVFGAEGEYIAYVNWKNYEDKQFYLGQYIFISAEIEKMVDALLEKSEIPPIIILQSDHGTRVPSYPVGDSEWQKILNVMYLPGMDYSELSDSMSPVNTFRLIFNHYFGADYPLLEDD